MTWSRSFPARLVAFAIVAACAARASAETPVPISGRVVDRAGAAVADAEVGVPELHLRTASGADGAFSFAALAPGRYTLAVRRIGYEPAVMRFSVPSSPLAVTLSPTALEIAPLDVTGTRAPIDPERSPLPSAALSGDRLRREHTVSLAHAIESLPGVRTLSTGGQVGKPVLRGLAGPRVLVLEDGYRLEDYSWSDEDGPSIDARLADRVEVIRGPASVLYGSDALGGVVNAVPADLPDARGRPGFARLGLEAYGASNNAELGSAFRFEGASRNFGARLFAVGRAGHDLHTPDGEIPNTGFGAGNGEAALGLRGAQGGGTLRFARYGGEFKLLEAGGPPPAGSGEKEGGPVRKLADNRLQLGGNLLLGGLRFESKVQWQRHSLIEVADEPGGSGTPGTETEQFHLVLDTYTADLLAHHETGGLHGTLGVSGLAQTNDTRTVGSETLPVYRYTQADARIVGGELVAQVEATPLISLGARTDYVSGQNLELDQPLPLMPPWRGSVEAELHRSDLGWAERASLGVEIEHVAEQNRLGPFDVPTDAYTLIHLDAGMRRRLGGRTLQLDLRVRNLADTAYRNFLSRYKEFALDPGRNLVLRLSTGL